MKKGIVLLACFVHCTTIFAQNEKTEGDAMAAVENYSGAAAMYRLCMEQDGECRMKLIRLLYEEKIAFQTTDELAQLISPLARQRNAEAQFYLGMMYYQGFGVEQNYRESVKWIQQSAGQRNADAQNQMGQMYRLGQGLRKNLRQAKKWYTISARQGNTDAQSNLRLLSQPEKKETQKEEIPP